MSKGVAAQLPRLAHPSNTLPHKKSPLVGIIIVVSIILVGISALAIAAVSMFGDVLSGDSERQTVDATYKTVRLPASLTLVGTHENNDNFIESTDGIGYTYEYSYPKASGISDSAAEAATVSEQITQSLESQAFTVNAIPSQEPPDFRGTKILTAKSIAKHLDFTITVEGGDNFRSVTVKAWQTKED